MYIYIYIPLTEKVKGGILQTCCLKENVCNKQTWEKRKTVKHRYNIINSSKDSYFGTGSMKLNMRLEKARGFIRKPILNNYWHSLLKNNFKINCG